MCHVRELFPKPISLPKNLIRPPPAPWVPGNQELLMLRCFPGMLEHCTSILWAELSGGFFFFFVCLSLYFNQLSAHNLDELFFFFFFSFWFSPAPPRNPSELQLGELCPLPSALGTHLHHFAVLHFIVDPTLSPCLGAQVSSWEMLLPIRSTHFSHLPCCVLPIVG